MKKTKKNNKSYNRERKKSNMKKNSMNKRRTNKTCTNKTCTKIGGEAIASGSYGCVFSPALTCANRDVPYIANNVSKLMMNEDAQEELKEINKITQYISDIPNHDKYFLASNVSKCTPSKLPDNLLTNFDSVCGNFKLFNIDSKNVNENLHKLTVINYKNGGLDIEKYMYNLFKNNSIKKEFVQVNNALIRLLLHGIVPLNRKGVNHFDVKAGNILMSSDGYARLIDWGISSKNDGITVPSSITERSISFNLPFSSILFNKFLKQWLPAEIDKIKTTPQFADQNAGQAQLLKVVALNLINKTFEEMHDEGHYDYIINGLLHNIYKIYAMHNETTKMDYNILIFDVLVEYIQAVLTNYMDRVGNLDEKKYFYQVFSRNADIWGFLLVYAPIIENGIKYFNSNFINALCRIFIKYCFSSEHAVKPIDVNEMARDLISLNTMI